MDRGVDIEIHGTRSAIYVENTTLSNPICFLRDHTILGGGVRSVSNPYTGSYLRATVFQSWVITPDENPAQVVTFEPLD